MSESFTESSLSKQDQPPGRIANFQIEGELGRGGMGLVYLAQDTRLHRQVAIKALPPEFARKTIARARFEEEARILASMNHPHIASIYQFVEHEGVSYLVLEYVAGKSLSERMRARRLEPPIAFSIALQIATALSSAHDKGVIHRDLKPENVHVTPDWNIKILDFGLAQTVVAEICHTATPIRGCEIERVEGTPAYMSPEQARGEPVDQRTDIWAFGCVFYSMLTGRLPFAGHCIEELFAAIVTSEPDWTLIDSAVPEEVIGLIRKCLEKDTLKRQAQLRDAVEVLSKALRGDFRWENHPGAGSRPQHNLPRQFSTFVGRDDEVADLKQLIKQSPIVTLTGFGGTGKTRLALEVAFQLTAEFSAGTWLVELAALNDPKLVGPAVAKALGVREKSCEDIIQTLIECLRGKKLLLVIDNCEHLLTACGELCKALLQNCPGPQILATSREPLHVDGETDYCVSPLRAPDPATINSARTLISYCAPQLFAARAVQYKRDFAVTDSNARAVATICWQLDGIPLALELAAARLRLLSVERLAEKLIDRFRLLTSGNVRTLPRHRTLRALIDWSYNLLDDCEKQVLQRISVFRAGCTLQAMAAVCRHVRLDEFEVLQILSALVEKSLLIVDQTNNETRYRMLETVRQYCEERLVEAGDAEQVRDQHLEYFVDFVECVKSKGSHPDEVGVLHQIEIEHNNLRAALDWCNTNERLADLMIRLAAALGRFWEVRGYWHEGRARLEQAVGRKVPTSVPLAKALMLAGNITNQQGDFAAARAFYEKSLVVARELNELQVVSVTLGNLANVPLEQGDYQQARELYQQALSVGLNLDGQRNRVALTVGLAEVALAEGKYDEVLVLSEESLQMSLAVGNKKFAGDSLAMLGYVAINAQDYQRAQHLFEESLTLCAELDYKSGMAHALMGLGDIHLAQGETQTALAKYQQALQIHRDLGYEQRIALSLEALAECLTALEAFDGATKLLGAAYRLREKIGAPVPPRIESRRTKTTTKLRSSMGPARYLELWTNGESMAIEPILDYVRAKS